MSESKIPAKSIKVLKTRPSAEIEKEFFNCVLEFLEDLIEATEDEDLVFLKLFFSDVSIDIIRYQFQKQILPFRDDILKRNEQFFMTDKDVFSNLHETAKHSVPKMKELWKNLNDENKEATWNWFKKFLQLIEEWDRSDGKIYNGPVVAKIPAKKYPLVALS